MVVFGGLLILNITVNWMDHFSLFTARASRNGVSFFALRVSPVFFCLDCGFMMCYGIHETTMKPNVLSNASMYTLINFTEVEASAHRVFSVRTLCRLSFLEGPLFRFIPPLKISPLPLAESSLVIESHQAN